MALGEHPAVGPTTNALKTIQKMMKSATCAMIV
jgi:hypothetical protein